MEYHRVTKSSSNNTYDNVNISDVNSNTNSGDVNNNMNSSDVEKEFSKNEIVNVNKDSNVNSNNECVYSVQNVVDSSDEDDDDEFGDIQPNTEEISRIGEVLLQAPELVSMKPSKPGNKTDDPVTSRVIGVDSWCSHSITANPELVKNVNSRRKFIISGHTKGCSETVNKAGTNQYLGEMMLYANASATLLSQAQLNQHFRITVWSNGQRMRIEHKANRNLVLWFSMDVPGYKGVLACRVPDDKWEILVSSERCCVQYAEVTGEIWEEQRCNDSSVMVMSPADYKAGLDWIDCHRVLGCLGHNSMERTSNANGIVGMPKITKHGYEMAQLIMDSTNCVYCRASNYRKRNPKLNTTPPRVVAKVEQPLEVIEVEPDLPGTIGVDLAYFDREPYLVMCHRKTQYVMVAWLNDRQSSTILKAAERCLNEYVRNREDQWQFTKMCLDEETVYNGEEPKVVVMDGEQGLQNAFHKIAGRYGIAVKEKTPGSHVSFCERAIGEIRRKQMSLVSGVEHVMTDVEIRFSYIEAAVLNNLYCHTEKKMVPYTMVTNREVHYEDLCGASFGDAVVAMNVTSSHRKTARNESGICVGHIPRIRRGILFYNYNTGKVKARSRYYKTDQDQVVSILGLNTKRVRKPLWYSDLASYMIERSSRLSEQTPVNDHEIQVYHGEASEYSPELRVVPPRLVNQKDEMENDIEFEPTNIRPDEMKAIIPVLNSDLKSALKNPDRPTSAEQKEVQRKLVFHLPDPVESSPSPSRGVSNLNSKTQFIRSPSGEVEVNSDNPDLCDVAQQNMDQVVVAERQAENNMNQEIHKRLSNDKVAVAPILDYINPHGSREVLTRKTKDKFYENLSAKKAKRTEAKVNVSRYSEIFDHCVDQSEVHFGEELEEVIASPSLAKAEKDVNWVAGVKQWGSKATDSIKKEIHQLVDEYGVFEPTMLKESECSDLYSSRGLMTEKLDGTIKSRVIVSVKIGKNRNAKTNFGIDSYAPTLDIKLLFMMYSIAAEHNLESVIWDVKGAYFKTLMERSGIYVKLNREVANEIIKAKPEWKKFQDEETGTMIVECIKAWYGTEPAAALWNRDIHECIIVECRYIQHSMVKCLYYKVNRNNIRSFMLLHVDDINGMFPRDGVERIRVKAILEKRFDKLKEDQGDDTSYVGMDVHWNAQKVQYEIGMVKYIEKLATRFGVKRGVVNPNSTRSSYSEEESESCDQSEYRSLIGALRYCAMLVKPAALYAITFLSTKQGKALVGDYNDAMKVLRYLFETRHVKHIICGYGIDRCFHIWCDASFGNFDDGKSAQCIAIKLGNCKGVVYFGSWKQSAVASSVGNSEVMCLGTGVQYGRYFKDVFDEIGEDFEFKIKYYEDNQSCYDMVTGAARCSNLQEKFIRIRIAKLNEYANDFKHIADFIKVVSGKMVADGGTKGLFGVKFHESEVRLSGNDEADMV